MIGALALGVAFGPLAAGAAFDRYGSYAQFLVLTMAFMAASSLALATLGRPRFGVQVKLKRHRALDRPQPRAAPDWGAAAIDCGLPPDCNDCGRQPR